MSRRRRLRRTVHRQHHGDRLRSAGHLGARQRQRAGDRPRPKRRSRRDIGALAVKLAADGLKPRAIITRQAIENAIAVVAATGGSTNAVLHLLAIAVEAGVALALTDFDRISAARRSSPT